MIFTPEHCEAILAGKKTQTRRVMDVGDTLGERCGFPAVFDRYGKMRYVVTGEYAVQPGRGVKAVGRIKITEIRRRQWWNLSTDDILAEGVTSDVAPGFLRDCELHDRWEELWKRINPKHHGRDQEVWALTFEVIKDA